MCEHCDEDHPEIPKEIVEGYTAVVDRVESLSPELRTLLIEETLTKVKEMIGTAAEEENPIKSRMLLGVADNCLNLAGLANAHHRGDHEEWTATGDSRVSTLWNDFVGLITKMIGEVTHTVPVFAENLPEDTLERFASGDQTPEDLELVKAAMRETGIDVPDDANVIVHGMGGPPPEEKKPGVGLYL